MRSGSGRTRPQGPDPPAAGGTPPRDFRGRVQFHPSHGEWIKTLRSSGFVIDALYELYAPQDAGDHPYYSLATAEWARQWPVEEIWVAHLASRRPAGVPMA
ncbi:MAG TPA: hypothetical protein VFO01_16845 [Trebonia sp.]|nr:hypothetical protein [Trebonia sp.]